jgi:hypothetical protein
MTTTNHPNGAGSGASESEHLLKTDVLGRTRMSRAQREVILDAFESSGMTGQAFALQHGIKVSAQQNLSIQGKHGCHRFEIYGNYTRNNINRISEE